MKIKFHSLPAVLLAVLLAGCYGYYYDEPGETIVEGFKPVYGTPTASEIKWSDPRTVTDPGKIYIYNGYLLVNEIKRGIHVFDNADPTQPENLGFIEILGNTDMAIRDGKLYADHMGNLVLLNINGFSGVEQIASVELQNWNMGVPPPRGSHFECVDASKGLVVSWESVTLKNPDCYAY